jgi:hypothetical protein
VGLVQKHTGQTVAAYTIGELTVTQPANHNRPLEDGMQAHNMEANGLNLLGSRVDRTEARPGDPIRVTTLWQTTAPTIAPAQFTLQLVATNGDILLERSQPLTTIPTTQWQINDRFRSAPTFRLPANLPSGSHTWQAQWGDQTIALDTLTITAPERTFNAPEVNITTNTQLGDTALLLGANLCPAAPSLPCPSAPQLIPSSSLVLTLFWQALAETGTSYRVFVHLRTADGQIMAQSDGEPAQWTRPTTGWLPPEIITDEHTIQLPADIPTGTYTLVTGLYDPTTGQRLFTPDNSDAITIVTINNQ